MGRLRGADRGPEIHDGLVIGRGSTQASAKGLNHSLLRQQALCQRREFMLAGSRVDGRGNGEVAGQHPIDIAVDHRHGQVESDRGDGRRRIVAHALQLADFLVSIRKSAHRDNLLRSKVQVAGPRIIAEALPKAQHLVLGRRRQLFHAGPSRHEPEPVVPALLHLRLLQDNL